MHPSSLAVFPRQFVEVPLVLSLFDDEKYEPGRENVTRLFMESGRDMRQQSRSMSIVCCKATR